MKPFYLTLLPVLGLGLAAAMEVRAETWPTKPLRAIVPVGAGSTTDIIPRVVFDQLSAQLGQSIVVVEQVGNTVLVAQSYSEGPGSTDPEAMMRTARDFVDSLAGVRYEIGCAFRVATCS